MRAHTGRPPRVAHLTRRLGRIHGLGAGGRALRPLRTAARRVLLKLYPAPAAGFYVGAVAEVAPGLRMRLDPRSLVEWEVLFTGYEPEVRELLRRAARPAAACIDVGANAGAHTLVMAGACAPAPVIACEPNPELRARLEANLALNGLANVRVRPYALAASTGRAVLHVPRDPVHTGGASLVAGVHEHLHDSAEVEVEAVTLDDLVEREGLDRVGLLKIDVEGYEGAVLAGGARLLARERPDLAFEYTAPWWDAAGYSLPDVLGSLEALGYEVRAVTWRGLRPLPSPLPDRLNVWATARSRS